MKINWKATREPADDEIERDVAELRSLLSRIDEPSEPHPAYWQNFLVRVRERVDDNRGARRSWAPSVALTSLTAALLVVVVAVSGVIPMGPVVESPKGVTAVPRREQPNQAPPAAHVNPYADASESLMLSTDEVQMLDAILEESPEAVLAAMVEGEGL